MSRVTLNPQTSVGIVGGGQLAKLLASQLLKYGVQVYIFAKSKDEPACQLTHHIYFNDGDLVSDLIEFFKLVDVAVLESEFILAKDLKSALNEVPIKMVPAISDYEKLSSKKAEKEYFQSLEISQGPLEIFKNLKECESFDLKKPSILKCSTGGYDGYGNTEVKSNEELRKAYLQLSQNEEIDCLLEEKIQIKAEYSIMGAKQGNDVYIFPSCETIQKNHINHLVKCPSGLNDPDEHYLAKTVKKILSNLEGEGIFAFEFFMDETGALLINESAPRPHNSYHFSMDGFDADQFDILARILIGLPIHKPKLLYPEVYMVNLLGKGEGPDYQLEYDSHEEIRIIPYLYLKKENRLGRKMGHINIVGDKDLRNVAEQIYQRYHL